METIHRKSSRASEEEAALLSKVEEKGESLSLFLKPCKVKSDPVKRIFDIFFSLSVLVFASPLYLLIALAIKVSSRGPVFYMAERVGRGGRCFGCWKFRTMFADADLKLSILLAKDPELREEWRKYYKLKNDPRITPLGNWLRKTSLDELPQFWNVLKGDLSVVGPRPFTPVQIAFLDHEVHELDGVFPQEKKGRLMLGKKAKKILSVRPGITGLWQTSGRNLLSYDERVKLEIRYAESYRFFTDLKIILKTVVQVLFPKGAY